MSSLASIIRSGLIWRARPLQNSSENRLSTPSASDNFFVQCTTSESRDLQELCCEQIDPPTVESKPNTQKISVPFGISAIDTALATDSTPEGGLPYGTLHEWYVKSSLPNQHRHPYTMFAWLAVQTWREVTRSPLKRRRFIFWIGKDTWPAPHLLAELSRTANKAQENFFDYNFFLDVTGEKEHLWTIETALRSNATALVIAKLKTTSLAITRRLHLAAQKGNSLGLFSISDQLNMRATSAHSRWSLEAAPVAKNQSQSTETRYPKWNINLEKWRGAQPRQSSWQIELSPPSIRDLYFNENLTNRKDQVTERIITNHGFPDRKEVPINQAGSNRGALGESAFTEPTLTEPTLTESTLTESTLSLHISPPLVDRSGDEALATARRAAS